jgi:uncharacterized protein Smg (DUF494 family)
LFLAEGQTGMTKLIVAFRNCFVNALKYERREILVERIFGAEINEIANGVLRDAVHLVYLVVFFYFQNVTRCAVVA